MGRSPALRAARSGPRWEDDERNGERSVRSSVPCVSLTHLVIPSLLVPRRFSTRFVGSFLTSFVAHLLYSCLTPRVLRSSLRSSLRCSSFGLTHSSRRACDSCPSGRLSSPRYVLRPSLVVSSARRAPVGRGTKPEGSRRAVERRANRIRNETGARRTTDRRGI